MIDVSKLAEDIQRAGAEIIVVDILTSKSLKPFKHVAIPKEGNVTIVYTTREHVKNGLGFIVYVEEKAVTDNLEGVVSTMRTHILSHKS